MLRRCRPFRKGDMNWVTFHDANPQYGAPYGQHDRKMRDDEVVDFLKSVKNWRQEPNGAITRKYVFPTTSMLYEWLGRVMAFANWTDKYPNMTIQGTSVEVVIFSGRFQGLTKKEAQLAALMNDQAHMLKKMIAMQEKAMSRAPDPTTRTDGDGRPQAFAHPAVERVSEMGNHRGVGGLSPREARQRAFQSGGGGVEMRRPSS
eukprot:PhM_4_TR6835/c0_g1_i1/m.86801